MTEAIINGLAGIGVYCLVTTLSDLTKEVYKHFFIKETT